LFYASPPKKIGANHPLNSFPRPIPIYFPGIQGAQLLIQLALKATWFLAAFSLLASCKKKDSPPPEGYRQAMRNFVKKMSDYAKSRNPNFAIIPQNGLEIIRGEDGSPA
jgi:hypothetical protein